MARVSFLIGGVQKGGTTALAQFLGEHPQVALPLAKEAHVFDDAGVDDARDPQEIDGDYAAHFAPGSGDRLHGDATPIYILHPKLVRRIAAYNPAMKWILILRHPLERALSQYHMERARGRERLPFWLALLLEPWRLRGHEDDLSRDSPTSRHSYRLRGDYARQLDVLYAHFPHDQVLVLFNDELDADPGATLGRVHRFLGLAPFSSSAGGYPRVFEGDYARFRRGGLRWWLHERLFSRALRAQRLRYGIDWENQPRSQRAQ